MAVREEQNDKGEVYPLNGIGQLVLNQGLRDMGREARKEHELERGEDRTLDCTPRPLRAKVRWKGWHFLRSMSLFLPTRSSIC